MIQLLKVWTSNLPLQYDSMALKKNSPYKYFFNKLILKMIYNGELYLFKQRNSELKTECNLPSEEGKPLNFFKTASIFATLCFGVLLSTLFLLCESYQRPKKISYSLSEEKMNLLSRQMSAMVEKFENTDIENLRKICKVLDSTFCITTENENS